MRTFAACLGLCLLLAVPHLATGQTPVTQVESARNNRYRNVRRPMTPAEQAIYQRAATRAVQREARIEARKWTGESPLRPFLANDYGPNNLDRYIGLPYAGYYAVPFGW